MEFLVAGRPQQSGKAVTATDWTFGGRGGLFSRTLGSRGAGGDIWKKKNKLFCTLFLPCCSAGL